MSDDLSPAEQARAARWAADVADEAGDHGTAKFFRRRADRPAPPESVESLREQVDAEHAAWLSAENALHEANESVESLRAERDEARIGAKGWEHQVVEFRRFWLKARDDLDAANDTIASLRSTHVEAEAAWERCKRQPRVWKSGDPEPEKVQRVRDRDGDEWVSHDRRWCCTAGAGDKRSWRGILNYNGPLTEVLHED